MAVFNVIAVVLLFASAFSDRISPDDGFLFIYLGMGLPVFVLANLFFLFYWLFSSSRRIWVLIPLLSLLLVSSKILTYCPINLFHKEHPQSALKVMTYNVFHFQNCRSHSSKNPNPILQYLIDSDADILFLQEFSWSNKEEYLNKEEIIDALSAYPYYRIIEFDYGDKWHQGGAAVFSKYPLSNAKRIYFDSTFNGAMSCNVKIKDKTVKLFNLHLESNKFTEKDRSSFRELFNDVSSNKLKTVGAQLFSKFGLASGQRAVQADILSKEIEDSDPPILVCGDFNDTPTSYTYRTIRRNLRDAFVETGNGVGITYNQNRFYFRIDNIFYSSGIEAYECRVEKVDYSDHYPVWCYISL